MTNINAKDGESSSSDSPSFTLRELADVIQLIRAQQSEGRDTLPTLQQRLGNPNTLPAPEQPVVGPVAQESDNAPSSRASTPLPDLEPVPDDSEPPSPVLPECTCRLITLTQLCNEHAGHGVPPFDRQTLHAAFSTGAAFFADPNSSNAGVAAIPTPAVTTPVAPVVTIPAGVHGPISGHPTAALFLGVVAPPVAAGNSIAAPPAVALPTGSYGLVSGPPNRATPKRWFAITRGLAVGVIEGWSNVSPLVTGVSFAVFQRYSSQVAAQAAFDAAEAAGTVAVLP